MHKYFYISSVVVVFVVTLLIGHKYLLGLSEYGQGTDCANAITWLPVSNVGYNSAYQVKNNQVYFVPFDRPTGEMEVPVLIPDADAKTFMEVWQTDSPLELYIPYGKDKNHVFHKNEQVAGADPKTFQVPTEDNGPTGVNCQLLND